MALPPAEAEALGSAGCTEALLSAALAAPALALAELLWEGRAPELAEAEPEPEPEKEGEEEAEGGAGSTLTAVWMSMEGPCTLAGRGPASPVSAFSTQMLGTMPSGSCTAETGMVEDTSTRVSAGAAAHWAQPALHWAWLMSRLAVPAASSAGL